MDGTLKIFGRKITPGQVTYADGQVRVDAVVEKIRGGFKITGTISGRAGTIEVFRGPPPRDFLMNNWQSWGPMQKMFAGQKLEGIAERMANYSRYVFTPVPEVFARHLVSDYFLAWAGGLAGFLASRVAHPYFVIDSDDVVGFLEYFGTMLDEPVALEPLIILEGEPIELLLEEYGIRTAMENRVFLKTGNPVGWSSWYHYFTDLRLEDVEKNLRIALKNAFLRSFMHKKWWLNDPDCLLLRKEDIALKAHERELYARRAGALDNMIIESDDLELVDEWGREVLAEALRLQGGNCASTGF